MRMLLVVVLALLAIVLLPTWPHSEPWGWGYYPSALLALLLIAVLVMAAMNARGRPH